MAADTQPHDAQPNDLFGRWLAHHEQQTDPGPDDSAGSNEGPEEPAPSPGVSRRLPAAAVASAALERDPVIGARIVPPSNFGARRGNPSVSSSPANELDRELPAGWEPILTRSVRKKVEKTESRHTSAPVDRPSRFQRLKARLVDPPAPVEEPAVDPVPLAPPVMRTTPPVVATPSRAPARTPLPTPPPAPAPEERSIEETVRATVEPVVEPVLQPVLKPVEEPIKTPTPVRPFLAAAVDTAPEAPPIEPVEIPAARAPEPTPAPEAYAPPIEPVEIPAARTPEPTPAPERERVVVPEPVVRAEPEPVVRVEPVVVVEPEPVVHVEPEPEPMFEVEPEPEPEPEPVDQTPEEPEQRRSFLSRPKRSAREPRERGRAARSAAGDAARDLVAAKAKARATTPTLEPETATVTMPAVAVEAAAPEAAPKQAKVSRHDEVAAEMPGVYKFAPKRTLRRILTLAMLIGLVISAYFVRAAIDTNDTSSIGLAAIVVLATAMVWAIRAGASTTKLEIHQGQLTVIQQGGRFVFDMASQYTHVEVHGKPGRHGWKVLFPRRGMAPFTIDGSMVDPDDFMRVLRFFRPELVHH